MSLSYVFSLTTFPKPKDPSFTIINDEEKQQILTLNELELVNVWHFACKMTELINQLSQIVSNKFSFHNNWNLTNC